MPEKKFEELYAKLNAAQREAVDAVEGPVMVVAGPGTGKTQMLTLRIANILKKTDTAPSSILALTFTESGVASMRRRLAEIIGSSAYSVVINTFHGFCNDVIKNYPEQFPLIVGSQSITEVDQINILEEAIEELPLQNLKPFGDPMYYLRSILSGINELKREGVDMGKFADGIKKEQKDFDTISDLYYDSGAHRGKMKGKYQDLLKRIKKNEDLAEVYRYYEAALEKAKLYDYSDMIMEVLTALSKNPDLLLILQEQHQYILVDEHQDTNTAQNRIIELLCNFHANPNVFVVGDEKQAIFRFQGASLENFLYFKKLYPEARLVILEDNYRSTQAILDPAHSLIPGAKKLKANAPYENQKIQLYAFSRPEAELYFLAKDISKKIDKGTEPHEIAVLYRDNRDVFPVAKMLEKFGVPFSIESDQDILGDVDVKKIIFLLRAIHEFGSQDALAEAMHIDFLGIEPLDIYKIIQYANKSKISLYEVVSSEDVLNSLTLAKKEKITEFYKNLSGWKIASKNKGLTDFFEELVRESGFLAYALAHKEPISILDKLNGLFDEVKGLAERHKSYGLKDFLEYIDTLLAHNVLVKKSLSSHLVKQVRLMTAHKSKGLEFEYVYIVNVFDGHWGNKRRPDYLPLPERIFSLFDDKAIDPVRSRPAEGTATTALGQPTSNGVNNDDERRLFYVALTRAKKGVIITYAKESANKREQLPAQFMGEITADFIETKESEPYEKEFAARKEILFAPSRVSEVDIKNKEFIGEIFLRNGLAVTALNNYLECPWKYFYTNLLRIPKAPSKHQMYGIAVHNALKDFFNSFKERTPEKELLLNKFRHYLNLQPLNERDLSDSLKKGLRVLDGYYENYHTAWRTHALTEFNISGILLTPEIRLTGKIDKIEILEGGPQVNVVDYKTGKPKTRGEIEGSTKNSNGDMKRQLVFYNLLLDRFENGKFKMVGGDIDFIEPDEKGRYKKEGFIIQKEEITELEELLKKVSSEILNLEFWDKTCSEKDCKFCALRVMMA